MARLDWPTARGESESMAKTDQSRKGDGPDRESDGPERGQRRTRVGTETAHNRNKDGQRQGRGRDGPWSGAQIARLCPTQES